MKALFRSGKVLCVSKQTLLEAWVVATRPRDVNGFGFSPRFAADGLAKIKRLFHVLPETDTVLPYTERFADPPVRLGAGGGSVLLRLASRRIEQDLGRS